MMKSIVIYTSAKKIGVIEGEGVYKAGEMVEWLVQMKVYNKIGLEIAGRRSLPPPSQRKHGM